MAVRVLCPATSANLGPGFDALGVALGLFNAFEVEELETSERAFQGHRVHELTGSYGEQESTQQAGTYLVRTAQPLAILIFHMLEPESADGLAAWGLFDRSLRKGRNYPVEKCFSQVRAATRKVRLSDIR